MATQTITQLMDDLNPELDADETVRFGLDGVEYDIDLTSAHAEQLRQLLDKFVTHARRTGGRARPGRGASASPPANGGSQAQQRERTKAMRAWGNANGFELTDRGRIPLRVVEAYEAAQEKVITTEKVDTKPRVKDLPGTPFRAAGEKPKVSRARSTSRRSTQGSTKD